MAYRWSSGSRSTLISVKAEFEPIYLAQTSFIAHHDSPESCFYNCLSFSWDSFQVCFFKQTESRPLNDFFKPNDFQMHLDRHGINESSFNKRYFERFTVTEPLGCSRFPPHWVTELDLLLELLCFCRGKVDEVEFWYHPIRWRPVEAAVPWHVIVNRNCDFTIRGPTMEGFLALEKKLQKAIQILWPGYGTYDRFPYVWKDRTEMRRRATTGIPEPSFVFVQDARNSRQEHTANCSVEKQGRYWVYCNCGDWDHFGQVMDRDE
ncbi:hypothetical protein PLIIFM63780_000651 [Purpureocillium lilacinum]|nr:hypothetical protein PLIIFM63780_000651 [Purpureocillium lilacinum]